jgi:hypothetical protein
VRAVDLLNQPGAKRKVTSGQGQSAAQRHSRHQQTQSSMDDVLRPGINTRAPLHIVLTLWTPALAPTNYPMSGTISWSVFAKAISLARSSFPSKLLRSSA